MSIHCSIENKTNLAILTFGSEAQNALSSDLLNLLINHVQRLDTDESIKMILIHSNGDKTFCAGADLNELLALTNRDSATEFFTQFAKLILAIRQSPHTILVRVQGKAVGGALGMIAAADYVIASEKAQIRLSELINGIGPFVVGPAIERKIGLAAFNHMTLNPAQWFDADWSKSKNLFNETAPDIEKLDEILFKKIQEFSSYSTKALREIKAMMWQNTPYWDELLKQRAAISGRLILTQESKNALEKLKK